VVLPQAYRLRHRFDFDAVYQGSRRVSTSRFLLRIFTPTGERRKLLRRPLPEDWADRPSRFGLVISTKISKRAHVRNKLRRRIHGILIDLRPRLKTGKMVVITVKSELLECSYAEILRELTQLLTEARLLHECE
jgi:ribonuclease P protein component